MSSDPVLFTTDEVGKLSFHCPGCGYAHVIYAEAYYTLRQQTAHWLFNNDLYRPTFTPSVLVQRKHGGDDLIEVCCFSIIEGRIKYASTSTHGLAGCTVDMLSFASAYAHAQSTAAAVVLSPDGAW